jgi:hypothetical protein
MEGNRSGNVPRQGKPRMSVDQETQIFLNLYVDTGAKTYRPPAINDPVGDIATRRHLQEVAAQEVEMLDEIASIQFQG